MSWRVGSKVPINVYEGDRPVCQCQTALDARRIVDAMVFWELNYGKKRPDAATPNSVRSDVEPLDFGGALPKS